MDQLTRGRSARPSNGSLISVSPGSADGCTRPTVSWVSCVPESGRLRSAAVTVKNDEIPFGDSRALLRMPLITHDNVASGGRFLALLRPGEETPKPLVVVQNWVETLKER